MARERREEEVSERRKEAEERERNEQSHPRIHPSQHHPPLQIIINTIQISHQVIHAQLSRKARGGDGDRLTFHC